MIITTNSSSEIITELVTKSPAYEYESIVGCFRAYITPFVAIIGIIGNIFVILTFYLKTKSSRFSIYCINLAFVHTIGLIVNSLMDDFLGRGLSYALGQYLKAFKWDSHCDFCCKIMEYVPNTMFFVSSFITVIFSIDRLITIHNPIKFHSVYYIKFSIIACGAVFVIGLCLNIPLLLSYGLVEQQMGLKMTLKCTVITAQEKRFLANFGLYLKILGTFIIPTFIVFILNTLICLKIWQLHLNRTDMIKRFFTNDCKSASNPIMKNQEKEFNRVLGHLAVNVAFLLLTMPSVIVMILRMYSDDNKMFLTNLYLYNAFQHLSRLFSSLKDVNFACEFFIYLVFLPNFRNGFLDLFRVCQCQPVCVDLRSTNFGNS